MLVRPAAWEQSKVTGGISLDSPFSLTSGPVAAVYCCNQTRPTRWYSGVKSLRLWNSSVQLWNCANSSSPASPQQKTGQHEVFLQHIKRGKFNSFISLFTSRFLHFCKSFEVSAISYDCLFSRSIRTLPSCGYSLASKLHQVTPNVIAYRCKLFFIRLKLQDLASKYTLFAAECVDTY